MCWLLVFFVLLQEELSKIDQEVMKCKHHKKHYDEKRSGHLRNIETLEANMESKKQELQVWHTELHRARQRRSCSLSVQVIMWVFKPGLKFEIRDILCLYAHWAHQNCVQCVQYSNKGNAIWFLVTLNTLQFHLHWVWEVNDLFHTADSGLCGQGNGNLSRASGSTADSQESRQWDQPSQGEDRNPAGTTGGPWGGCEVCCLDPGNRWQCTDCYVVSWHW